VATVFSAMLTELWSNNSSEMGVITNIQLNLWHLEPTTTATNRSVIWKHVCQNLNQQTKASAVYGYWFPLPTTGHRIVHGYGFIVHLTLQPPTFLYYINIYGTRASFELPNRKILNSKILAIFQILSCHMLAKDKENYQNLIINKNRVCYHCGEARR
jgi:hypothetical protein